MQYRALVSSAFFVLAFCVLDSDQNASTSTKPESPSVDLPKGEDAWAVRVVRSGGLNADTFRDITIKSTGQLTIDWGQGKQEATLSPDALKTLGPLVLSAGFPQMANTGIHPGGCNDCYTTAITVRRRERKGKERTYSAAWAPVTVGSTPENYVSISRLVLGLSN
jgi:hypothetical protein